MDKKIDTKRTWPKGYVPKEESDKDLSIRLGLMTNILNKKNINKIKELNTVRFFSVQSSSAKVGAPKDNMAIKINESKKRCDEAIVSFPSSQNKLKCSARP